MTTTTTDPNGTLLDAQDLVRDLLGNLPQLGEASEVAVTAVKTVRVSINPQHTRHPAEVLLAWAELLDNPEITGMRVDPLFTSVYVQGVHAGVKFTVGGPLFGEREVDELLHDQCGQLSVEDLRDLASAGAR